MTQHKPYYQLNKRYVKFLSVCKDPKCVKTLLHSAPDHVIKTICNAALNAQRGDVRISKSHKRLFQQHRKLFASLVNKKVPIKVKKRQLIRQKGGAFPLIPILLSTVLSSVGSLLFSNKSKE